MPIYEYSCKECGNIFEKILRISELEEEVECPKCESLETVRHVINNGGFRLSEKGDVGWAKDGYGTHVGDIENFKAGRKVY